MSLVTFAQQKNAVAFKAALDEKLQEKINDALAEAKVEVASTLISESADPKKKVTETTETLDELSKKTLGSYVKKASNAAAMSHGNYMAAKERSDEANRMTNRNGMVGNQFQHRETIKKILGADSETMNKIHGKTVKRIRGVEKATDKLTKEEVVVEGAAGDAGKKQREATLKQNAYAKSVKARMKAKKPNASK